MASRNHCDAPSLFLVEPANQASKSQTEIPNRPLPHEFFFSGAPNPQTRKLVRDIFLGNGVAFFSSPYGPDCTYQIPSYGPGLDCELHPSYMMSARCHIPTPFNSSYEVHLNTSASPQELPRDWISPGSHYFLEQTPKRLSIDVSTLSSSAGYEPHRRQAFTCQVLQYYQLPLLPHIPS